MAFDPDAFLAEGGGTAVAEFDPDKFLAEPAAKAAPAFDPDAFLAEPAAPASSPTGDFIKRAAASATQGAMQIGRGLLYADEKISGLGKLSKAVFGPADPFDLMRKEVVRFAADVQEAAPAELGVDPAREGTIPSKLAGAAGSVLPIVATGGLAPIAAAAMMGESQREDAEAHGAGQGAQDLAFGLGAGVGVVSELTMGLPALLRSAKAVTTVGKGAARQITEQVVKGAAREGAQEGVEQIGQNLIAKGIYDPNRGLLEGVPESIALGAAVGGPLGGTVQAAATVDAQRAGELKTGIERDVAALGLTPEEQVVPEVVDTRLDKTNEFLRQTPSEQVAPSTEPLPPPEPQTQPDPNQPPPAPPKESPPAAPASPSDSVIAPAPSTPVSEPLSTFDKALQDDRRAYRKDVSQRPIEQQPPRMWYEGEIVKRGIGPSEMTGEEVRAYKQMWQNAVDASVAQNKPVYAGGKYFEKPPKKGWTKQGELWVPPAGKGPLVRVRPDPMLEKPPSAPADPNDYVVQLKIGDELVEGGPDDNHKSLFERHTKDMDKGSPEYEAAVLAFADDSAHVFKNVKDPEAPALSRDELATALGENKPVQSERLRVLKAEWAGRSKLEAAATTVPAAKANAQSVIDITKDESLVGQGPRLAVKLDDGTILHAGDLRLHAQLADAAGVDPARVVDAGWYGKLSGEFRSGASDAVRRAEDARKVLSPTPETKPAPAQPPPVPPKAAPPAAPAAPSDPSPTGIRNAVVDKERVERGLPERMAPLRRSFGKLWDEAMARVDKDAQAGPKLVAEIAENPRPLEDWESALLAHEQVTRQNAFDKAVADVNANPGNAEAAAALTTVRNEVQEIYDAGQKAGTKSGQSLAARKLLVNDDYTLAKMEAVTRAVVNDGKPLTAQQAAEVQALHKRIAETEKKLAEYESKETERASQDAFANLLKELKSEAKAEAKSGKTLTDFLDTQADKARARIRKRSGALNIGINPAELADHVIIGSSWIAKGITKLADFTARMVKEFGEAIRPHLPDIFSKAKDYHAANASLFGRSTKPQKSAVEAAKANAAAGKPLSEGVVFDLAREKVRGGAVGLDAVMKAVHAELEPLHPGLTEREVRDAFSGYGKTKFPSKEADLVALRELRRLGQLVSAIEDAQSKQAPKKSGMQRDDPTQAVREKVKELHEAMKANGIETTSPEQQLKSSNAARATALRNQIADLDKQLATGTKPTKGSPAPDTSEVETLRAERDAMKEKLAEIEAEANPPRSPDEIRLEADKKAIATRTRKLQEKIAANDYTRPVKKEPLMDDAKVSLMFENKKAKEDYARGLFEADLAKRNTAKKILGGISEVISTSKAVMTAVDLSAVGRQGGFIAFGNPVRTIRAIPDMIRALFSEKAQFRAMEQIKQRENSKSGLYDRAKLFLSDDTSVNLKKLEEQFNSRWAQKIPVVAGSGRAFNTFLNRLRADTFDAMVASLAKGAKPTIEEAKAVANFINVATGRGTIQSGPVLGSVFFAPKLVASRFQLIGGQPFYKGTNRTRVLVAKEYGKFLTGVAAMYALAAAFSDKDEKEPVIEFDPRSSDFGKIRIGNTRIDPLVGLAQVSVLTARVLKGEKKTLKGKILPLTGPKVPYGGDTTSSILGRFARTKFSPLVGAIVNAREGKNVVGQPTTPGKEALGLVLPLSLRDVYDVIKDHGVPTGTALTVVSLFGFGMQNYSDKKPAKAADGT